ncbi:MAG: DUF3373 family protein [Epsilonproteobacteria bacterium]|nr:DUF3373 family protein [Campylobacterota bacterium]
MKKILLSTTAIATMALAGGNLGGITSFEQSDTAMSEIEALKARITALENEKKEAPKQEKSSDIKKLEKKIKRLNKKLSKVNAHDAFDNIKFSTDFRTAVDNINYKYNNYSYKGTDLSGTEASNDALITSRLILNMKSAPTDTLTFYGQLAAYYIWGAHLNGDEDPSFKSWSASSKASDTLFRVRRAYFVYSDDELPYSFSIGRRPSSDGFLINHRENEKEAGSPLAHITNMEVDAAMVKLKSDNLVEGSYLKLIYGRAHAGGMSTLYDATGYEPYAQDDGDVNENVDFFVALASLYNDGQYNLMGEHAIIFDTKGARTEVAPGAPLPDGSGLNKSLDAGTAQLTALSLQVDGIGNEINDFLDDTIAFASIARSAYDPDDGKELLGSTSERRGYSYWLGVKMPDMITDDGKFGLEYNYGTQYWTPMTWAEDTAIGSKLAVRGSAYEAYWNFNLMGEKNLPAQIRYTHVQHDYTPNIRCSGWVKPVDVDIESDDIRFSVSYKY